MNVLFVAPFPSHPSIQGSRLRALDVCRAFQRRGARLTFLCWEGESFDADAIEAMQVAWDDLVVVRRSPDYRQQRSFAAFHGLDDWYDPAVTPAVARLCLARCFDVCVVTYVWMSAAFEPLPQECVRVIDTQDVFGGRAAHFYERGQAPVWYYTAASEEGRGLDRADLVVAIQDNETSLLQGRTQAEVTTVGYLGGAQFLPPRAGDGAIVAGFIASANPFNVASALAMVESVKAHPPPAHVRLLAAGPICDMLRQTPGNPFALMGVVDHVEDFYAAIDIALNPMQGGTGLKIKTVEALSFGRAMIGTVAAFEGIATQTPEHACVDVEAVMSALGRCASEEAVGRLREASRSAFDAYHGKQMAAFDALCAQIGRIALARRAGVSDSSAAPEPPSDRPVA